MDKCHFIGIGGIGMSGLARILLSRKIAVSGSDLIQTAITEQLFKAGAEIHIGQKAENVTKSSTVVYSTDIKVDNPEFIAAKGLQCRLLHRSDLLKELMQGYKTLAVAGTHGKTTTTALLTTVLLEAGWDPSFAVGGILPQLQVNAGHGKGDYFVAEADESDGTFLKYAPFGAIVTNIDLDHMDHYKTEAVLKQAFQQFLSQVISDKHLLWCGEDARLQNLCPKGLSYGFHMGCVIRATNIRAQGWKTIFDIEWDDHSYTDICLNLLGNHNVLNATAVFALAMQLGVPQEGIRTAFASFAGVGRRCEQVGENQGVTILDDYAHHPTEIAATLQGIQKAAQGRRVIAVYQPHRYTRTRDSIGLYKQVFEAADQVIITDIYSAREAPIPGISHETILSEIDNVPKRYVPKEQLIAQLLELLRPHDIVVTLGAGDITKIGRQLAAELPGHKLIKWQVGVVFGGHSVEHEISLLSSRNIIQGFCSDFYDVHYFGITKQRVWLSGKEALEGQKQESLPKTDRAVLSETVLCELQKCDVFFPILHGPMGEDGTIQGFFEILGKPYVGCDWRACAIAMDKLQSKRIVEQCGLKTPAYVSCSSAEWKHSSTEIVAKVLQNLRLPLFVKPTHLGSSVGVRKVEDFESLRDAIEHGLEYDTMVIIENGIKGRELEIAVLGSDTLLVTAPGEILTGGKPYDYAGKYCKDKGMPKTCCAELPTEKVEEGKRAAAQAYQALGCQGMARVDFLFDEEGVYWFNELNPIPGFTNISLYPQMCQHSGVLYSALLDRLLIQALQRKRIHERLKHDYTAEK